MLDRFNARAGLRAAFVSLLLLAAPAFAAEWPKSDIPADPSIDFGRLPNGMRYAIRHNSTPSGEVSVRFHIAAGAIQEAPDQRGLAHFLEHMAFRGSKNVKDGDYTRMLERIGLRFGSDTNASTGQEETIYQFDLPRSDDVSIDTALTLSREIASNLIIDPAAARTESGVVLSELQLRELPSFKALVARLAFLLRDERAAQLPHGEAAVIAKGSVEALRAYYHAYYRPERATLIVVGDIDPARIEDKIRQYFGDWKGVGEAVPDPKFNIPLDRGLEVASYTGKGVSNSISLTWTAPAEPKPYDKAAERAGVIEMIALRILNRRYQEESVTPQRPFTRAGVSRGQSYHALRMTTLSVGYEPGAWKTALVTAERMRRAILETGATQPELDRALREMRSSFQQRADSAATRPSRSIVNSLLQQMGENDVYTSDERDLATWDEIAKGLTLDEVNKALRDAFIGGGALIFAGGESEFEGGDAAIRAAYLEAQSSDVGPSREQVAAKPWTYTDFGRPGTVVSRQEIADLGATFVRFANGVRLTVRPSKLRVNQIQVAAKVGNGRLSLPRDRVTASWASSVVVSGGLKDLTSTEISRTLSGRQYGISFSIAEDGFTFSGGTTRSDVALQMQVLAAFMTAPAFRADAFERSRTAYLERLRNAGTSPGTVMSLKMPEILHAGDKRWASATQAEVEAAKVEDLRDLLLPAFEKGPIDVTIVGDITVDRAIEVTAATFGAFAPRTEPRMTPGADNTTRFPDGGAALQRLVTTDQKGQEIVTTVWPTHGRFPDVHASVTLALMTAIMQERLFDRMRGLGTVYVAQVGNTSSKVFDYGYIQALAQLEPASAQKFHDELARIVAELQGGKLTEDDLTRARNPTLEQLRKSRETNDYWLSVLDDTQHNPAKLDLARKYESSLKSLTVADIVAAARKYLVDGKAIKVSVGPPAS